MQKLYCYVDETGQDTNGELFVVAVALFAEERDKLLALCEEFERQSGKNAYKWHKARYKLKIDYMRRVLTEPQFVNVLHYSLFAKTKDYDLATIIGTAKAIHARKPAEEYTTVVYIDALKKSQRKFYAAQLRKLDVPTLKVQGVEREESNAFMRLADALAGFVRDALTTENEEIKTLLKKALHDKLLTEV